MIGPWFVSVTTSLMNCGTMLVYVLARFTFPKKIPFIKFYLLVPVKYYRIFRIVRYSL